MKRALAGSTALLGLALPALAHASTFDPEGHLLWDPNAVFTSSLEEASPKGLNCENTCTWESLTDKDELPLEGSRFLRFSSNNDPLEVDLGLPNQNASYRFRAWVRHARVWARAVFEYDDAERGTEAAWLFPTGRVTSDGWVELESNPASVTGRDLTHAFLRVEGSAVDLDGIEVVRDGEYDAGGACAGAHDPICGPEASCIAGRCRQGSRYVPLLPPIAYRESVARYFAGRVQGFFGGRFSRAHYLPSALGRMADMKTATTPWQFWSAFTHGVRLLHDWHTSASAAFSGLGNAQTLGVCFIEGDADLSQNVWPSTPGRADILVSHVGPDGTLGLHAGDRLVAVDGVHPVDWILSLTDVNWTQHVATDVKVDADLVEQLRDLLPRFAKTFSVVRCDPATLACSDSVETIDVSAIPSGVQQPACDNRPFYHLANPPEQTAGDITTYHYVPFYPWRDAVVDSQPGENIYGMTFDTLYGGPNGLTQFFLDSNDFFEQNARGVILDHRAGNGGTIDAPQAITRLVRAPEVLSVGPNFMNPIAFDGPATQADGKALATALLTAGDTAYAVGSPNADPALPVALIIHRDGSASDWLPHGMKGAPNVRVFGPHQTAGAFSSFYQFSYWSRFEFQLASGDTYAVDGTAMLGHGIEPDEIVEHTQTSLLQGKDAPYEAALAWVRSRLKP